MRRFLKRVLSFMRLSGGVKATKQAGPSRRQDPFLKEGDRKVKSQRCAGYILPARGITGRSDQRTVDKSWTQIPPGLQGLGGGGMGGAQRARSGL